MANAAPTTPLALPRAPILAAASFVSAGILLASFTTWGIGEEGLIRANRYLARAAFLIFFFIYTARPAARLWRSPTTRGLLRGRRTLGIAFAIVQLTHAATILALFARVPGTGELDLEAMVGGSSMLLVALMAATSNDAAVRALGRNWRRLHAAGVHLLWFLYLVTYGGRVVEGQAGFMPLLLATLVAMGVRIAAAQQRRTAAA